MIASNARFLLSSILMISLLHAARAATLEWDKALGRSLTTQIVDGSCYLFISGVVPYSASSLAGVTVELEDGEGRVGVTYSGSPFADATGQLFRVAVGVSNPKLKRVVFGKSRAVLWTEAIGCAGAAGGGEAFEPPVERSR